MYAYIDSFLEMMLAERGASSNTIQAYRRDLQSYESFLLKYYPKKKIEAVDAEILQAYLAHLTAANYSSSTSARRLSSIKQFYSFLYSESIRSDDPTTSLDSPRRTDNLPKYLSEKEVETLIETARKDTDAEGLRLVTLLEILYASGLRVSELIALKLSNLKQYDAKNNVSFLTVAGKGNKERIVPLNHTAMDAIQAYLKYREQFLAKDAEESPWLFPSNGKTGYITRQRLGQLLKQLAIKAGIDPEKVSPHVLRHSFASHLLNHGMDLRVLQELLGHSDISTTQIYTHIADDRLKSLVEKSHPLAKKGA